jgi:hypothetical protein
MKPIFNKARFYAELHHGFAVAAKHRFGKNFNADGTPTKAPTPAVIGPKASPVISGGSPIMSATDRSRVQAKAPTSDQGNDFVAIESLNGVGALRPGEVEHLAAHGISAGIRNGVLCVTRKYAPAATGIIQQGRSGSKV